jgi:type VI secretion system secreted protein VgrG
MAITQHGRLLNLSTPLPADFLLPQQLTVSEGLSKLFRVGIDMLHEEDQASYAPTQVDPQKLIGQAMSVEMLQTDGPKRYVHGICIEFVQGNRSTRYTAYHAELVPQAWLLTQRAQSRIFQNISVPDILKKVLTGLEVTYEIQGTFEPRNYCVQYRETDWDFVSRLMEEEGIYYYFEHTQTNHKLIIANTPQSHRNCPTRHEIPIIDISQLGREEWQGVVRDWGISSSLRTGKYTLWDHNFQLPDKKFEDTENTRLTIGGNNKLEIYDYPGGYAKRFDGVDSSGGGQDGELQKIFTDRQRTAKIRQEEIDAGIKGIIGMSDCCSMTAGYRFTLSNHPNNEYNKPFVLVALEIDAVQSPQYASEEGVVDPYHARFTCLPYGEGQPPYRPPRLTPKPVVHGSQTAIVVGPPGEEIFTDKYGRVKVQFHWDREGKYDSGSSCWVRVAQTWAGKKWGAMFIPRIGMEVIVDFFEGDPDQPIIVGCVYNAETMPPYTLPDEKTKSTIKTDSSKGGGGFNELRFEDKKGSEQIFIHAEKNQDIRVKNDCMELIKHDRHLIIENEQFELVKKDKHLQVKGDHNEKIDGTFSLKVGVDQQDKVGNNYALDAGMAVHIKAGMTAVIEAGTSLTLKCGGSSININPGGIQIIGTPMLTLNSGGSAGSGAGCNPETPKDPKEADTANPGERVKLPPAPPPLAPVTYGPLATLLMEAAQSGTPFCDT